MGADTKGYLNNSVTATDVFNVVVSKFDKDAEFDVRNDRDGEIGSIIFKFNDENHSLFYCVTRDKHKELVDISQEKKVALILGYWGSSIEIITEIVKKFGGYIDENDCDEEDAYYISNDGTFVFSDYVTERENIMNILDESLSQNVKMELAIQIMKHKDQLLNLLGI